MPKPLRSNEPNPTDLRFRDFGVLNDGKRSKSAAVVSTTVNVLIVLVLLFLVKAATVKPKVQHAELIDPIHVAKPEPPPPPKLQPAPPAPRAVNMMASAAHVPNNDAHPSAVRLGSPDNPLKPLSGPAVQRVSMGVAGMPGMPGSNTGGGPRAVNVSMGSGSPGGRDLNATSPRPVAGVAMGCVGCAGPLSSKSTQVQRVAMNTPRPVMPVEQPRVQEHTAKSTPTVVYKPEPVYTEEAKSMHLEGSVAVRIRVTVQGTVEVLGVEHGLGHGLDEAARQAAQGTRFKPALDASGNPVPWEGVVNVHFQMS